MSSIISTQSDFLAFIKDQAMPNGNLSTRGVARCCGVKDTSLIRGAAFSSQKLGQTLTQHGFEGAALAENGFPPEAVALCIEYFAYESRAKSPMAKQLARTFGSIGIKTTLEKLTEKIEFPDQITGSIPINPIADLAATVGGVLAVVFHDAEPEVLRGMVLESVCIKHPELRPVLEVHKPKMILEAPLLSPTDLGIKMELKDGIKRSGVAVNKLLLEAGLQVKTGEKNPAYRAIGSGIEFSKIIADTARGHGKTVLALRWYESVIDQLTAVTK